MVAALVLTGAPGAGKTSVLDTDAQDRDAVVDQILEALTARALLPHTAA